MFTESAEFYDLIYGSFKNYVEESALIASIIRERLPGARSVLDVACGTGEHASHLSREHGFAVDGIDLDSTMLELARSKNPKGHYACADMCGFALNREYDVVLCLFSSIGYARTLDGVSAALACFRNHMRQGGLILVEPWFAPGDMKPGFVTMNTAEDEANKVCRISFNEIRDDRISRVHFEYLIGRSDGIRHVRETHELGLFTKAEMEAAFEEAGLATSYDPQGLSGRGLFLAGEA